MIEEINRQVFREHFGVRAKPDQLVVALAGNPNVGKSTVFNVLTGLRQHTGNWPGKTVDNAQGVFSYRGSSFLLVDLPGTYSLLSHTVEEQIARDFICFGHPDATLVVLDATCLERNLNLALQVMEITSNIVVCVNLMDEARKKKIHIDIEALEAELQVPVVATAARVGEGIQDLKEALWKVATKSISAKPTQVTYSFAVEEAVQELSASLSFISDAPISRRWLALRLLDGNPSILASINEYFGIFSRWGDPHESRL